MTPCNECAHHLLHSSSHHDLTQEEGVTQRMSLKGSQTGNTSGCCQNASEYACPCVHICRSIKKLPTEEHGEESKCIPHTSVPCLNSLFMFINSLPVWISLISQYSWSREVCTDPVSANLVTDLWPLNYTSWRFCWLTCWKLWVGLYPKLLYVQCCTTGSDNGVNLVLSLKYTIWSSVLSHWCCHFEGADMHYADKYMHTHPFSRLKQFSMLFSRLAEILLAHYKNVKHAENRLAVNCKTLLSRQQPGRDRKLAKHWASYTPLTDMPVACTIAHTQLLQIPYLVACD